MKKILITICLMIMVLALAGCGAQNKESSDKPEEKTTTETTIKEENTKTPVKEETTEDNPINEEQALEAIKNYCYSQNAELKNMESSEEYTIYWEVTTNENSEIVVLYRSYTGAQIRYYVNPSSGQTYSTEFVPGITDEEEKTDESLNVRDYLE